MAFSKSMGHFQQACKEHPDLGSSIYDQKFQETMRMVQDFYRGGEGNGSCNVFPFDVLKRASSHITENITEAAEEIVKYKKDIGSNIQLLHMVRSYFKLCRTTMDSLNDLRISLGAYVHSLRAIVLGNRPETEAVRCAEDVMNSSFLSLTHLIGNHVAMLTALQQVRGKDMPGAASPSRSVIDIVLVTLFATAVICSILAAAFNCPPALPAFASTVITVTRCPPFVAWMNGLWVKVKEGWTGRAAERVCQGKKKPTASTQDLETIKHLTDNISRFRTTVANDREGRTLLKDMTELDEQLKKCVSDISQAKLNLLKKVTAPSRRRDRFRAFIYRKADALEEKTEILFEKMSETFERFGINERS